MKYAQIKLASRQQSSQLAQWSRQMDSTKPTTGGVSKRVLYVVSLNHMINDGSTGLISTLFPAVILAFGFSEYEVGILVAVGYLVNMICQPITGHYSESFQSSRLLALGISMIAISMALFTVSSTFPLMLFCVILLRVGSSFFHPVGISAVSRSYAGPELDSAMGFQSSFGNLGVLIVFLISAPIYLAFGWQAPFILFAAFDLITVAITLVFMSKRATSHASSVSETNDEQTTRKTGGRLGLPLFFIITMFISGGSYAVFLNFGNILLVKHFPLPWANALMSAWVLSAFFGGMVTGWMSRFISRTKLLTLFYVLASVATLVFGILSYNVVLVIASLLTSGFALAATYPIIYSELSAFLGVKSQKQGTSFGILFSGQIIGSSIMGFFSGYAAVPFGLVFPFEIVSLLLLIAAVIALAWDRSRATQRAPVIVSKIS